jgi:glucose/arabinose dehydrogenase
MPKLLGLSGHIMFDNGGMLLLGLGDGGVANDFYKTAGNPRSLWGKILRINVDGAKPYSIPRGNANRWNRIKGARKEILMSGLRNPWRFTVYGGRMYIADGNISAIGGCM